MHYVISLQTELHVGVPQGSIFGPISFLLYINHIDNTNFPIFIASYVNDTLVIVSVKSNKNFGNHY